MILLGFLAGWAAATWWWPWVLSFYEKPVPPTCENAHTESVRLQDNGSKTFLATLPRGGVRMLWRRDGGP